jgi:hypothetical protein
MRLAGGFAGRYTGEILCNTPAQNNELSCPAGKGGTTACTEPVISRTLKLSLNSYPEIYKNPLIAV